MCLESGGRLAAGKQQAWLGFEEILRQHLVQHQYMVKRGHRTMAPISQKRRREEDGVRKPKKKIHVKRQKYYHSDSEDEDEDQPVVSDAPVKRVVDSKPQLVKTLTGSNQHPVVKRAVEGKQQPKSILKQARTASPAVEDGVERDSKDDSDEDDGEGVDVDETELNTALNAAPVAEEEERSDADANSDIDVGDEEEPVAQDAPSTSESDLDASASDSDTSLTSSNLTGANNGKVKKKRNDPTAFATSITRILDTKLTTSKRADPVLSRSATAQTANKTLSDQKLESAAKSQLRTEKRAKLEKGRVRDVLGLQNPDVETGAVQEEEKRLKKVAQRGVVRLFNAVRAAQVRAEKGEELVRGEGVVGMGKREERVGEMSKEGFLELISKGGEKAGA